MPSEHGHTLTPGCPKFGYRSAHQLRRVGEETTSGIAGDRTVYTYRCLHCGAEDTYTTFRPPYWSIGYRPAALTPTPR